MRQSEKFRLHSQVVETTGAINEWEKPNNANKKTNPCHRHRGPVGLLGFPCFFSLVLFFVFVVCMSKQKSRVEYRQHRKNDNCIFSIVLKILPNISKPRWKKSNQRRSMKRGPMFPQPHLWISSKCAFFV